MKKLIFKCMLLLTIVGVLLSLGGAAYKRTNAYRNLDVEEGTDVFYHMPDSIDIAVFGPSHGREDIRFPPDGFSFFNFSLPVQTPQYDKMMLLEYGGRFHEGTLVILTVTYLAPFWTDSEKTFSEKQPRYYRVLQPEHIVDVDLKEYFLQRLSPLLTEDLTQVAGAFLQDEPEAVSLFVRLKDVKLDAETAEEQRKRIIKKYYPLMEPGFPEGNPVMLESYRDILRLCRERGWTAVMVTPPYLETCNDAFESGFDSLYPVFLEKTEQLSQEFSVPYLNYSHDPSYGEAYEYYRDIDHLNYDGAIAFDKQLFADIQALGLLG